jgi:mannose-6-phosphate isomerase-like protein (cupin superfamily)
MERSLAVDEANIARLKNPGHWGKPLIWKETVGTSSGFEVGTSGYDAKEYPESKTHDDEEAIYIISGEGMALIGDQEIPLKPGTAIYVAPKTPHAIKRTSKEPLKAVYCHSGFGEGKK